MERLWTSVPDGTTAKVKAIADFERRSISSLVARLVLDEVDAYPLLDKEPKQ